MIKIGCLYKVLDGSNHAFPVGSVVEAKSYFGEYSVNFSHPDFLYLQYLKDWQVEEYIETLENK